MEFNDTWEKFRRAGLNKPGIVIRLFSGEVFLIGDINEQGGVCNCCQDVFDTTMIKNYYSVILDEPN